ncbi:MAG TPA: NAD(P)/FAD-dependent oxidoreductase [Lapillicoccus sp.]|nr:NAD(P)/FAD-dependent oxidoreductase [Lapillicoccus sp.]
MTTTARYDDIVVGAGHNGLTAAAYLARAGRRVLVLERLDHVGGAAVSAAPFPGVEARLSRYSYLVSLLPRQIAADLDLDVRLVRRRYASYTPLTHDPTRGLLVDVTDPEATRASFVAALGSDADYVAWRRFSERMARAAERLWPTVLEPLRSARDIRALVDDDELWDALTATPIGSLLRTTFADDTVRGIVATDALIGTFADLDDPSLTQNICFLYHLVGGGTGDWDVPVGGMGAVTDALAKAAAGAGADLVTGADVVSVDGDGEVVWRLGDREHRAVGHVHAGLAPARLDGLLEASGSTPVTEDRAPDPEGAQLKVNLLLTRLPRLKDPSVDPRAAFAGTLHLRESMSDLQGAYASAAAGVLPDRLSCEVYCHTLSDRSILGPDLAESGAQTLTLFGLHTPARLFEGGDRTHAERREAALAAALAAVDDVLAEPLADVLARDVDGEPCLEVRTPLDLDRDLGLPRGNIFHRPLRWPWAETPEEVGTWGVETTHPKVTICGAGARRGGGVSGIPGHNSAQSVLRD